MKFARFMIFFLHGKDTYRSRQKLNEIIGQNQKVHKSGLNLIVFDCLNSDFQDFRGAIETLSMFENKKLIILKNAFLNPLFEKSVQEYAKKLLGDKQDNIVFYEGGEPDRRKTLFKFLKEKAINQEFGLLEEEDFKNWTKKEFRKYGLEIEAKALETFMIYCGNDSWRVSNEIKKIAANMLKEKKPKITEENVRSLVRGDVEMGIFKTIEAISAKNKKIALRYLHARLGKGDSPLYLLSMINYQFRNLLLVKDLLERGTQYHLISKKANLRSFAVKKALEICRLFSLSELKKIYQKIFQADLDIKTGKMEPETALDLLISGI